MKKITLFVGGLFFAALLNAQTPATPATEVAKPEIATVLAIKESNHDFGKIPYGKAVEFDVEIKNLSKDSVKVENVKVGCGCTTPRYQPGPYAPGETFKVTLGFNGYTEGHFEKTADIFFSNGQTQQIRFHGEGYKVPEASAPANGAVQKMKS